MPFSSALCDNLPPPNSTLKRFDARFWHLDFPLNSIATIVSTVDNELSVSAEFRSNKDLVGLLWTSKDKFGHTLLQYLEDKNYTGVKLGFIGNPRDIYNFTVSMISNSGSQVYRMYPYKVSGANLIPAASPTPEIHGKGPNAVYSIASVFPAGLPALPSGGNGAGWYYFILDFDNLYTGYSYEGARIDPRFIQELFFSVTPAQYGLGAAARLRSVGQITGLTDKKVRVVKTVRADYFVIDGVTSNLRLSVGDYINVVIGLPVNPSGGGLSGIKYDIDTQTISIRVEQWTGDGTATRSILIPNGGFESVAWLGGPATAVLLQKDTAIGSTPVLFSMKNMTVTGARNTLQRRLYPQPAHSMQMTSGYDDTYNITPWRQVDNCYNLGYRGNFTCYMGMSHYFKASSGTTSNPGPRPAGYYGEWPPYDPLFNNKISKGAIQPLNNPTIAWCNSLFQQLKAKGFKFIWSTSYEILNSYMPEEWKQRDYQQRPALSGWVPPSSFIQPTNAECTTYLANVIKHGISLMRAAGWTEAECSFQIGEPWWWDGSYTQGAPCIYDPLTRSKYTQETGLPVPTPFYSNYLQPVTPAQVPYLTWLGTKLGQSTNTIRNLVKATYPTSKATLLFFSPQIFSNKSQNTPGLPGNPFTSSILPLINFPIADWKYPNYDFMQIEDYDWIINGELDKLPLTREAALDLLEYPLSTVHYFVGFVLNGNHTWIWPNINIATKQALQANIPNVYVWAYPQVIRDGILYTDGLIATQPAVQPPVPARRQLTDSIKAKLVRPVMFCQIGTDVFMNSSDRTMVINGNTYYATGELGTISPIQEGLSLTDAGWNMSLSHVPLNDIDATTEALRTGKVVLMLGLVDDAYQLIEAPRQIAAGDIQTNNVTITDKFAVITLSVRSKMANWHRQSNSRYTDEYQQLIFPGDRGFSFVTDLVNRKIQWGDRNA
ncbi:MAG: hypothetical protein JWR85_4173 [Marmoricola sp.]|nr:hypothetical protein [Marmoricola sp.]